MGMATAHVYLDGAGQRGAVCLPTQEKRGAHTHPGLLNAAAAGLPVHATPPLRALEAV